MDADKVFEGWPGTFICVVGEEAGATGNGTLGAASTIRRATLGAATCVADGAAAGDGADEGLAAGVGAGTGAGDRLFDTRLLPAGAGLCDDPGVNPAETAGPGTATAAAATVGDEVAALSNTADPVSAFEVGGIGSTASATGPSGNPSKGAGRRGSSRGSVPRPLAAR